MTKSLAKNSVPGNAPPHTLKASQRPTRGIDCTIEKTTRRPEPESRSSGSEYPEKPSSIAISNSVTPMTQLISRGRRNAPVKNTLHMWNATAAMNMFAAQWCA